MSPIPEISPSGQDSVSAMCQQLSRGLSLLSRTDDFVSIPSVSSNNSVSKQLFTNTIQGILMHKLSLYQLIIQKNCK